jgi:hypothetical protein
MKGYIYTIKSSKAAETYVGSTVQKLNVRVSKHHNDYKHGKTTGIKQLIDTYGFDTLESVVVEEVEYTSIRELREREQYYIQNTANCINCRKAVQHPNERTTYMKEWNKTKNNTRIVCECGGSYIYSHRQRHARTARHRNYLASL